MALTKGINMSCVAYWTYCKDCKHESYNRYKGTECEKCNSENVGNIVEFDEEGDHD